MKNTYGVNNKNSKSLEALTVSERLKAGGKVFSVEFFPPAIWWKEQQEKLFHNAKGLKPFQPDFVFVADLDGSVFEEAATFFKKFKAATGGELVVHLAGAKYSRNEIVKICARLKAMGIKNIFAIRGDMNKPKSRAPGHDYRHAIQLITELKKIGGFSIGGACYPEKHPDAPTLEKDIDRLKEKVDAGAEYLVTQCFFDNSCYFRFLEKTTAAGINVPILPGLMSIETYLRWMREGEKIEIAVPKALKLGIERYKNNRMGLLNFSANYALTQATELLKGGAPGVNVFTRNFTPVAEVILKKFKGRQ